MKKKIIHKDTENMENVWSLTVTETLCGCRLPASYFDVRKSKNWDKVTCKACLKQKED